MGVPDADPQPGDVYLAAPATSLDGDVHGSNARPVVVVERLARVANCLTRTTHPESGARALDSPADPAIPAMTKGGSWTDRHQRPVAKRWWGTPSFAFSGTLAGKELEELLDFWKRTKMLGR